MGKKAGLFVFLGDFLKRQSHAFWYVCFLRISRSLSMSICSIRVLVWFLGIIFPFIWDFRAARASLPRRGSFSPSTGADGDLSGLLYPDRGRDAVCVAGFSGGIVHSPCLEYRHGPSRRLRPYSGGGPGIYGCDLRDYCMAFWRHRAISDAF